MIFIMALSLAIGVGVTVWPYAFLDMRASSCTANFWRCSDGLKGLRNGVSIFLSTGYCVGTVMAILLDQILPNDSTIVYASASTHHGDDEGVDDLKMKVEDPDLEDIEEEA
jgi:NCS2 family nucleobase:cation symporter-2